MRTGTDRIPQEVPICLTCHTCLILGAPQERLIRISDCRCQQSSPYRGRNLGPFQTYILVVFLVALLLPKKEQWFESVTAVVAHT